MKTIKKFLIKFLPESNRFERIWKLAQVDFKKRFYNDRLGILWALLNPFFQISIYYFLFTYILKQSQENFAIFIFAGFIVWMTFNESAVKGMNILRSKRYLIENIQFNHIDLFISGTIGTFLGTSFNILAYLLICILTGVKITHHLIWLPLIMCNLFIFCIGVSLILSTIKIYLQDITHAWAIFVIAGFWGSGIFFPAENIYNAWPPIVFLNPLIGIIDNLRQITIYMNQPNIETMSINYLTSFIILILGIIIFKKYSFKAIELM